jgi:hypothetical protein
LPVVDIDRLIQAWQLVVNRHSILRAVCIDGISVSPQGSISLYDQVVLKHVAAPIQIEDHRMSSKHPNRRSSPHKFPLHYNIAITIDKSSAVYMELAISHAITDGISQRIILNDLATAYDTGSLKILPTDCYREYVDYLQKIPGDASNRYWADYLQGCPVCLFPILNKSSHLESSLYDQEIDQKPREHNIEFSSSSRLYGICASRDITPATVFQTAWALVLGSYVGTTDPCFGYLSSGRDLPIHNIEAAVGSFISMMIQRVSLENKSTGLLEILLTMQNNHIRNLDYQALSLAQIHRAIGLKEGSLFNTIMSVQGISKVEPRQSGILLRSISSEDPTEASLPIASNLDISSQKSD